MEQIKNSFDRAVEKLQNGIPVAPRETCIALAPQALCFASKVLMKRPLLPSLAILTFALVLGVAAASQEQAAGTPEYNCQRKRRGPSRRRRSHSAGSARPASAKAGAGAKTTATAARPDRVPDWVQTWDEPTYKDSAAGDKTEGEDPEIRKAAVEGLGPYNGSVVVVDPNTGRVLTMVNQQLALGGGFQPCSTIKVSVALAALREGLVARTSAGRTSTARLA